MDWASTKPGELRMPDLMVESRDSSQDELHWLLTATGIWEELHHLEEEQSKLQRTLQDVLRRRQVSYLTKPATYNSKEISGRMAMSLAAGLAFSGFVMLTLFFSGRGIDLGMLVLGGYISIVVAILAGALFAN
jgi:hypothetical protein